MQEREEGFSEPPVRAKRETVLQAFRKLWEDLFSSPIHLDSALSKQSKSTKSILAQTIPIILLRPASQAEAMGIGVPSGEPWKLSTSELKTWKPARILSERIYESMTHRPAMPEPTRDDFPPAMIQEWEADWGRETADHLVRTLAAEPPLSLRASRALGAAAVLKGLKQAKVLGVSAEVSSISPQGIRLAGYSAVMGSDLYEKGGFEIQDEGSQLMAYFALWPELYARFLSERPAAVRAATLEPLPAKPAAWNVVDACAGAGGKSLAIADALAGRGRIFSYDTSEKKLLALRRRVKRAGFNSIQAVAVKDGEEEATLGRFRGKADVVLVDAPCSGWGVLRRNPDIKWRQSADSLARMPQIQRRLLKLYSSLVAPGGRLVFGVCTFRKSETRDVVDAFLAESPEFKALQGGFLGPGPCDGFFMQAFKRGR